MSKEECVVCRDRFSLRVRKPITCPYCQFCCCMSCFKQYLLSTASDPACMDCKVQFSYEFLISVLPLTFWHNDYKEFRKELLLAKEESLLPETQGCVVRIKRKDAFYRHVKAVRAEIDRMFQHYNRLLARMNQMTELTHQERRGQVEIPDDHPYFLFFNDDHTPMLDGDGVPLCMKDGIADDEAVRRVRRQSGGSSTWVHACPVSECRGYLKGDQAACPVCATPVCRECLRAIEPRTVEHVCVKEDVETVAMLRQNTKPCPNCSMSIYKISGCDQMWCTQCRTPFSWRTGQKINQRIHNPHYYEWMQRHQGEDNMPRELMDIPCGGLPSINSLRRFPIKYHDWAYNLHQTVLHYEHVIVPRHQNTTQFNETCKAMRVSYLLRDMTREEWRDELYREEKAGQKHQQYLQIIQTFIAVSSEWLRRMVVEGMPPSIADEVRNTVGFFHYINSQIKNLNNRFKCNLSTLPQNLLLDQK